MQLPPLCNPFPFALLANGETNYGTLNDADLLQMAWVDGTGDCSHHTLLHLVLPDGCQI